MSPRRILLVDDEAGLRAAIADALRWRGHWVADAGSVAEAVVLAERESPELLVTDVRLGKEDGLGLARRLRAKDPALDVIVITGFGSEELERAATLMGARRFLRKPFRIAALAEAVESCPLEVENTAEGIRETATNDASKDVAPDRESVGSTESVEDERALRELLWSAPPREHGSDERVTGGER